MERLKGKINRIENKLHPSGEQVVHVGGSQEEVDRKEEEYLKHGNPYATIVRIVHEP